MSPLDPDIPPVGEEIHLPGPSLLPLLATVGISLALVGVTLTPILIVAGLALAIPVLIRWIRETLHEIEELPPGPH